MNGKATNLVLKIDKLKGACGGVLSGIIVEFYTATTEVIYGTVNRVGFDSDMAHSTGALAVHKLKAGTGKEGGRTSILSKGEHLAEQIGTGLSRARISIVHADVTEFEAKNG